MGSSDRKVHSLKIDTTSINGASNNTKQLQHDTNSSLPSLSSWSDENDTEEDFIESPKHLIHDWHTNKVTQDDMLPTSTDHHQQSPTLLLLDSKKKKWFQTSRSALKRYLSTPPTRCGYGGLRAGSVEPPQPPLQLLFNLQWSTSKQDDVNNHASSTPNSPVLKRYSHTARPDFIPSCPTHASNPCVFLCKAQVTRRSSLPVPELPTKCHQKKKIFVRSLTRSPGSLLSFDDEFDIPTLYFSDGEPVIRFSNIKSRKHKLLRKISSKPDYNALCIWRSNLNEALIKKRQHMTDSFKKTVPLEKKSSYLLTRKFILQEFYTTEITYWNQLNYIKVMYHDPLQLAIQRNSPFVRPSDADWFSNLSDLMEFSSNIIYQLQHYQQHFIPNNSCTECHETHIGKILCDMAESMAVFLHCALDYQANIKMIGEKKNNKGYMLYHDKLSLKKETRQFTLQDYLIVPIQRITRYGLLLADLEKHTEADDPDYKHIQIARDIIHSLALAMNYAQK